MIKKVSLAALIALFAFTPFVSYADTTIFNDDFTGANNTDINATNWHVIPNTGSYAGRTQFRTAQESLSHSPSTLPKVVSGAAVLKLNDFNPLNAAGNSGPYGFYGTDIISSTTYSSGVNGLDAKVRAKFDNGTVGRVGGIYFYDGNTTIGFELIGNNQHRAQLVTGGDRLMATTSPVYVVLPPDGVSAHGWTYDYHTYEIKWLPASVEFYIDGVLMGQSAPGAIIPTGPLHFRVSLSAPDSSWPDAYSATIQPSSVPFQTYTMSVDSVNIAQIAPANQPPVASAGPDQAIMLPTTSVAPTGTVCSDPEGAIGSIAWAQISGAASSTITSANTCAPTFTNLASPGSYTFRLMVTDVPGLSATDDMVVTVSADSVAPTTPTNVLALGTSTPAVVLTWDASTDNVGVLGYNIYRDGSVIATTSATTYTDTVVMYATPYAYALQAFDAVGNVSNVSAPSNVTIAAPNTAPTANAGSDQAIMLPTISVAPTNTVCSDPENAIGSIAWSEVSGPATATIVNSASCSPTFTDLTAVGDYLFRLTVTDAPGLTVTDDMLVTVTSDTIAPTVPTGVLASATSTPAVTLTWDASTDNVAVTGYEIVRNSALIATTSATVFTDINVAQGGSYTYQVRAFDAAGNYSTLATSNTVTVPDVTAPSAPTNFTAVVVAGQVNLSWSASTDNISVSGYEVSRNGSVPATTTALSFADANVAEASSYVYQIRAFDTAGNFSTVASANVIVPDVTAPTVPVNVTANVQSGQIALAWIHSTDVVGVSGYEVSKGGVVLATTTATTFTDASVTEGAAYQYQVRAFDAAGNYSVLATSNSVTVPDVTAPTVPTNFTAAVAAGQVNLSWVASADTVGVMGYEVSRGTTVLSTTTALTFTDANVIQGTSYTYQVRAFDAAGNYSIPAVVSLTVPDITAPSAPTGLLGTSQRGIQQANLSWATSTDNVAVVSYRVYRGGVQIGTSTAPSYVDTTVAFSAAYTYTVRAVDAANNLSGVSNSVVVTVLPPDVTAPNAPKTLTATALKTGPVTVKWGAATDNVGVTGYRVYRDGVQIATTTALSYSDASAVVLNTYTYSARAYDAAGNLSPLSNTATVTIPDTVVPTAPTTLTSQIVGAPIPTATLTWATSTDNVAVIGYQVFKAGTQIATTTALTYVDTNVVLGTSYAYSIKAFDAAGNKSAAKALTVVMPVPITLTSSPPTFTTTATTATASVVWATGALKTTGSIWYGTNASALTLHIATSTLATSHTSKTAALTRATTYYYQIFATSPDGQATTSPVLTLVTP